MQEKRLIELLTGLHAGLARLGPGSEESTLKALCYCTDLPAVPEVLDIGCGSGAQSLVLARATGGRIIAADLLPRFLAQLQTQSLQHALQGQIQPVMADMGALPFAGESFDLLWSEGAIYNMGFDKGLECWRPLLKPGGYLAVTELSWYSTDTPQEAADYWRDNYPAMRSVDENLNAASRVGWRLVGDFPLPVTDWTDHYFPPLQRRLPVFLEEHPNDQEARLVVEMTEREMALMQRHADVCGYQFYLLQRPEKPVRSQ